jgi:hypothetical protein
MPPTSSKTHDTSKRRGRPKKVESYADWMARVDASVDAMARTMERKPPTFAYLHPAQRRIVQMLIEHLRALPEIREGESAYEKREYGTVNRVLKELFLAKYPAWAQAPRCASGSFDVGTLPGNEGTNFGWMLRNCAGRAPIELTRASEHDDD